jgi:pimeloyl-ACP methyl ester carboxylesterase
VTRRFAGAVVVVALLSACAGDDDDGEAAETVEETTTAAPTTVPEAEPAVVERGTLSDRDCGAEVPATVTVTCSFLEVPEDRADPDGPTVKLAVAVLESTSPAPAPEPIVYLHGGPGGDAAGGIEGWAEDPLLQHNDIVLYDQRGSGLSDPNLECHEVNDSILANFQSIEPFDATLEARREAVRACRDRLVGMGIDLNAYDSEASAADLESLRLALGVEQWNLLGVSYGTRLALTYMRSFPERTRSVLLDSVYPTDVGKVQHFVDGADRALQQLTDGCIADPPCAAAYPDFATAIDRAYAQLNERPFAGDADLGASNGGVIPLEIDGDDAIAGLFTAMYDDELIVLLPSIIEAVAAGDYTIIPAIAQQGIPFATRFADGAALSIDCADNGIVDDTLDALLADPGRHATLIVENANTYCDIWDVEPTSATYNEPVVVDVPALVMAGLYDPVTPPADSEATAARLPNATYVEVDGIGHGVLFSDPCGALLYEAFLADPAAPLDTTCADTHPGPAFSTR